MTTTNAPTNAARAAGRMTALAVVSLLGGCLTSGETDTPSSTSPPTGSPPPSGNAAPLIFGNPPSAVLVGDSYSFTPQASDPDGDPLTFTVQNLPSWASFNANTGRISGSAELGMEGLYSNIRITVSDGTNSNSLAAFDVIVTQSALGSATLSWTPPTENEDGSPLTDLAGYRIFYGSQSGNYTKTVSITNPGISTYTIDNLVPDTYYFVSTAVNTSGEESSYSNETSITVL